MLNWVKRQQKPWVFERFKDGREDFQYDPRRGRPSTSRNADTIANVREMMTRDRRLTLRMVADELNKETIRQILHGDLRKRKICAKFVPHRLTGGQKQRRLTSCQDSTHTCQDNPSFLDFMFLFPKVKTALKGKWFKDVKDINKNVTA
jgi:hypothetical protein